MLKSLFKTIVLLVSLAWAGAACAVGFGTANVQSALGEPLRVEISLISVSEADRMGLAARLASPDNFKAVGLEYPYHLSKLKFEIVDRNNRTYILVTSREVVTDSFINLLVELNWKAGKLMREYTFLLDPPDYQAEQPRTEDVTPIEPAVVAVPPAETPQVAPLAPMVAASAPAGAGAASAVESAPSQANVAAESSVAEAGPAGVPAAASAPAETTTPVPETVAAGTTKTSPQAMPAEQPGMQAQAGAGKVADRSGETIKVKRGDTLSTIAKRMQEPDVTLEQMLVGLYRANIKQFDGRNMNRIRAGKILKMPEPEVFENLSQKAAVREIRIQTENWNAYRQKLAAAGTTVPAQMPKQEAGGKISTSVADLAPKPKEQPNGKLVLSHGETPGDKTAPGTKGQSAEAKAQQAREEAIAKEKAAQEEKMRIAKLEQMNQNMQNRIALQGTAPTAVSAVAPGSAVPQASGVAPASAVRPMPKAAPPVTVAEKSFVDDIVDTIFENDTMKGLAADYPMIKDPIVLGGGLGGVVLLIGGGIFMLRRRGGGGGRTKKKKLISKS